MWKGVFAPRLLRVLHFLHPITTHNSHIMSEEAPSPILRVLPQMRYYPEARLVTAHPRGVLNDEVADRIVEFIASQEQIADTPFHRYTDFNGLTEIHLKVGHVFNIAEVRRANYVGERVKSAFVSDWVVGLGIARMYEKLMEGAPIEVRAFRSHAAAAEWLSVREEFLHPSA